jgi:hypothetical protein
MLKNLDVDELKFNYCLDATNYPLGRLDSLQQVFDAVQHEVHFSNEKNFSDHTVLDCLDVDAHEGGTLPIHGVDAVEAHLIKSKGGTHWMDTGFKIG